jgi:hypothetical protein
VIGTRVALVPPAPRAALACIAGGIALFVVLAAIGAREAAPAGLAPLVVGLSLMFGDDRRFRARFTPTAVEIARPAQSIPYSTIIEVRPIAPLGAPRPRSFPIEMVHARGSVMFPATLTAPSERVYAFLRGHLANAPLQALPVALDTYLRTQEEAFGADRVFAYAARRGPYRHDAAQWSAVGKGFLVTAAAWVLVALARPAADGWYVGAVFAFVLGGACMIAAWERRRGVAPTRTSGAAIVISPLGLAMEQGPLNGHLTWQQIRKVTIQVPGKGVTVARVPPGIAVEVEGATFAITDSYESPLSEIHERILKYWR